MKIKIDEAKLRDAIYQNLLKEMRANEDLNEGLMDTVRRLKAKYKGAKEADLINLVKQNMNRAAKKGWQTGVRAINPDADYAALPDKTRPEIAMNAATSAATLQSLRDDISGVLKTYKEDYPLLVKTARTAPEFEQIAQNLKDVANNIIAARDSLNKPIEDLNGIVSMAKQGKSATQQTEPTATEPGGKTAPDTIPFGSKAAIEPDGDVKDYFDLEDEKPGKSLGWPPGSAENWSEDTKDQWGNLLPNKQKELLQKATAHSKKTGIPHWKSIAQYLKTNPTPSIDSEDGGEEEVVSPTQPTQEPENVGLNPPGIKKMSKQTFKKWKNLPNDQKEKIYKLAVTNAEKTKSAPWQEIAKIVRSGNDVTASWRQDKQDLWEKLPKDTRAEIYSKFEVYTPGDFDKIKQDQISKIAQQQLGVSEKALATWDAKALNVWSKLKPQARAAIQNLNKNDSERIGDALLQPELVKSMSGHISGTKKLKPMKEQQRLQKIQEAIQGVLKEYYSNSLNEIEIEPHSGGGRYSSQRPDTSSLYKSPEHKMQAREKLAVRSSEKRPPTQVELAIRQAKAKEKESMKQLHNFLPHIPPLLNTFGGLEKDLYSTLAIVKDLTSSNTPFQLKKVEGDLLATIARTKKINNALSEIHTGVTTSIKKSGK